MSILENSKKKNIMLQSQVNEIEKKVNDMEYHIKSIEMKKSNMKTEIQKKAKQNEELR
jgi:hypothetical protein